jgi:hypothetical protein
MRKTIQFGLVMTGWFTSSFISGAKIKQPALQSQGVSESARKLVDVVVSDFSKTYTGLIGGKYAVEMELTKKGRLLKGSYFYVSKGIPIKLAGTIDANGYINLEEFSAAGAKTGVFIGRLIANKISGKWQSPDAKRTLTFSVTEVVAAAPKLDDWSGVYDSKAGYNATLELKGPTADGAVHFKLSQIGGQSCAEMEEGTAYLVKPDLAEYYVPGSQCFFSFQFYGSEVYVRELRCSHGASCGSFEGYYIRK